MNIVGLSDGRRGGVLLIQQLEVWVECMLIGMAAWHEEKGEIINCNTPLGFLYDREVWCNLIGYTCTSIYEPKSEEKSSLFQIIIHSN